jgi:hypothetical protein
LISVKSSHTVPVDNTFSRNQPAARFLSLTKNGRLAGGGICPAARRRGVSRLAWVAFTLSKALDEEEQA